VPVIPLDRQVERDTGVVKWLVIGLLAILGFAGAVTFASGDRNGGTTVLLVAAGLATAAVVLGGVLASRKPSADASPEAPPPLPPPRPGEPVVLEYGIPRQAARPRASAGAVAAGFFSSIGVCALGFLILGSTANYSGRNGGHGHALILAAVVLMVVAFMASTVRVGGRWRGFGPGATAGLCLGMLALGPCAACYLLTLGG
jgi:hypothetical protein